VLPKHFGVLGTTGGGKSTTISGLIGQLQRADIATIVLDTEGEYTAIHEPTDSKDMLAALKRRGHDAAGVENTHVFHLFGTEPRNPRHPSIKAFRLNFNEISPYAFSEIAGLTDAQQSRFMSAFDVCKAAMSALDIYLPMQRKRRRRWS